MEAKTAFETKKDIEQSVVGTIDEHVPVEVETDASEFANPASLKQNRRLVVFFSRTLQGAEIKHHLSRRRLKALLKQLATGNIILREGISS